MLEETTQFNPQTLQTFINTLRMQLTPEYNRTRQDTINTLANVGALESSTTANALQQGEENFLNTLSVGANQAGLTQTMKALENRITLEGMGLNTLGESARMGQGNEQYLNQFNLSNYENQAAAAMYKDQNKAGGWLGALKGGVGGGLIGAGIGAALAIPTGGLSLIPALAAGGATGAIGGGLLGGLTPSSTSNMLMQGGMASAGTMSGFRPGSTASNNLFRSDANLESLMRNLNAGYGLPTQIGDYAGHRS